MKYISSEGLEKIKQELKERKTAVRQEIAERLEEAKSLGDLSENAEYAAAREAQAFNEGKILELEEAIKNAEVIKPSASMSGKGKKEVRIGSTIKAELIDGSKKSAENQKTFIIVGSQESDPLNGKISNESPLGRAFLNHQVGDIIEAETPKGKMKYKIIGIE